MIIYLAGSGRKPENNDRLKKKNSDNWGVLLSYKDTRTKDNKGSSRFKKLKKDGNK